MNCCILTVIAAIIAAVIAAINTFQNHIDITTFNSNNMTTPNVAQTDSTYGYCASILTPVDNMIQKS